MPTGVVRGALALWAGAYLAWSTRTVYGGSWVGIAARAFVLMVAYSVLFGLVTVALVIAAILLH